MSETVLIVPDELRAGSRVYANAGDALRDLDGGLRVAPPKMPDDFRELIISKVADILRDLAEQEEYIRDESHELIRRADLAEEAGAGQWPLAALGIFDVFGFGIRGLDPRFVPGGGLMSEMRSAIFGDREDRRVENDRRARIPPGGRGRDGHFDNDWAGREILERYLRGGGDWTIKNDPDWTKYMKDNPDLTGKLNLLVQQQALRAFDRRGIESPDGSFDVTTSMEMQNGEGIVGYEYLHGTNADAGGFQMRGKTHIKEVPGGYEVRVPASYTWNDVIDPNPQYSTDRWKSRLAEVFTLGKADPYDMHVTWSGEATVRLDKDGNVLSIDGYPGE